MSGINTNGINTSYPVPGVNNDTQGFRDNFTSIKNNLDKAATEITDLQTKSVVKSALSGTNINNDMANTLISNALVRSFRATTFNLGNNISTANDANLSVTINVSAGDVHYGTLTGNTTLKFAAWAPENTQSNVSLILNVANANAVLRFPDTTIDANGYPSSGMTLSVRHLEHYSSNVSPSQLQNATANNSTISFSSNVGIPAGTKQLHYVFSSLDCGRTINVDQVSSGYANRSNVANTAISVSGANVTGSVPNANVANTANVAVVANRANTITYGTPTVTNFVSNGTVNVSTTSTTVTGTNTLFQTQLVPGRTITNNNGQLIGVVANIANNTSLTLRANSAIAGNNLVFRRIVPIGDPNDVPGAIRTDGSSLYVCVANYNGTDPIWRSTSLNMSPY